MNLTEQARPITQGPHEIARDVTALLPRIRDHLLRLGGAWRMRRQRVRQTQDLLRFTDRDLWDVGLSRSDLPAIMKGVYRRE